MTKRPFSSQLVKGELLARQFQVERVEGTRQARSTPSSQQLWRWGKRLYTLLSLPHNRLFMRFHIFAYMQINVLWPVLCVHNIFVLFNHQAVLNHIWRDGSLSPGGSTVLISSRITPPHRLQKPLVLSGQCSLVLFNLPIPTFCLLT